MRTSNSDHYIQLLDRIPVPSEKLEAVIYQGQLQAKLERRNQRLRHIRRGGIALLTAAAICCFLIIGTRWSPVLAKSLAQIPFFSELVLLIADQKDKGMMDIVEHEYYEVINQTKTVNDISLNIKGVIADEYGLVIFYNVSSPHPLDAINIVKLDLLNQGKPLEGGISSSFFAMDGETSVDDQIKVYATNKLDYSSKQFELSMVFNDKQRTSITIPFQLTKPIAESKRYSLQQEVSIDGQHMELKELIISPIHAQLTIAVDDENSWQLLTIDSAELIDEHGEQWGGLDGGITSWGSMREGELMLYFQSNYFRNSERLKLRLSRISALPKGEDYILIDFAKQKVLYQPERVQVQFEFLPKALVYTYKGNTEEFMRSILSIGIDAAGNTVYSTFSTFNMTPEEVRVQMGFELEHVTNPVRFDIAAYPNLLPGVIEADLQLKQ